jgi:trans-aconitate 2-methyltransferase
MKMNDEIDLDAQHYRTHSDQQYSRVIELLNPFYFDALATVLDIGCGDGRITAEIANRVPQGKVIGIDASFNMIRLARESFPNATFPNLEFHCIKAEEIHFVEQFEKIVCFNCILWVRKAKQALDLMCKSLKTNGELLILTYLKNSSYVDFLEETLKKYPQYRELSAAQTMLSANDYECILKSNHLKLEEFTIREQVAKYKNSDDLKSYLKGWLTSYVPLPQELQDSFLDQAVRNSFSHSISDNDYPIALPYQSLAIRATKPYTAIGQKL